jgi:hypothetical protein
LGIQQTGVDAFPIPRRESISANRGQPGQDMSDSEYSYLCRRAEAELEQARRATTGEAATVHHQLAEAYLERAATLAAHAAPRGSDPS